MIKTLNPYNSTNTAKTAEIMSRYRPIAPRPETSPITPTGESPALSQKIRDSPYLRNLWPQLQARPTRTRKRGRAAISPPTLKRQRTNHVFGLSPACHVTSPVKTLTLDGFTHPLTQLALPNQLGSASTCLESTSLVTLPLLSYPSSLSIVPNQAVVTNQAAPPAELNLPRPSGGDEKLIDLNSEAEIPEEKDLLKQLQGIPSPTTPTTPSVISPQPIRPVGSSISVGCINTDSNLAQAVQAPKKPEDVESEVELEALPAIISDSHNKVRMANAAYKEMVGQPECSWLDSMVATSCKRIGGEVALQLSDTRVPTSSNGFSCWVRIEWGNEMDKHAVNAFCDVMKLACESKDYLFTWRFHTHSREASQSSSNEIASCN
ncbi:uncharacterized protein LOC126783163 [Argentina anserina]|uniref:uncharacterized protein LOC126783163 n=1 Tax=Argentina anserina TaxID=57926 RepID=UPI0021763E16|nr:uncharacterized protein LOC126783163 [Potentilla anserina]